MLRGRWLDGSAIEADAAPLKKAPQLGARALESGSRLFREERSNGGTRLDSGQGAVGVLEYALQYAARGWAVFPLTGYKTPFRGTHGHLDASADPATVERLWAGKRDPNVGLACGQIVVFDLDGPSAIKHFSDLVAAAGGIPETLTAQTARGLHLFFTCPPGVEIRTRNAQRAVKGDDGIDVKGKGGYVVLTPSINKKNGFRYRWLLDIPPIELPKCLQDFAQTTEFTKITASNGSSLSAGRPEYLKNKKPQPRQALITKHAKAGLGAAQTLDEMQRLVGALAAIPASCPRDPWLHVGFALHSLHWTRDDGSDIGFDLWDKWSASCPDKYSRHDVETRWRSFGNRDGVSLGTLFHIAEQHGWINAPPEVVPKSHFLVDNSVKSNSSGGAHTNGHHSIPEVLPPQFTAPAGPDSPLIELNAKYACIGDVGGKCLVLGWVPSKMDPAIEVPSFQTFKSFAERYGHRYVTVNKEKPKEEGETESKQVGAYWLKWRNRRSFDGIDLVPGADHIIRGNVLNLWRGFATPPAEGCWDRMKAHMAEVLADGNRDALDYIVKWSAWAVQHPGERAEAALVFRGGKGSGKGTFAHAMRRLFGMHGLHISNPKHLVGAFNAHLRNCLLLYADEAFWAGDKQGESTLKALITESTLTIEQKGVDAVQWHNRIHLIMTANAEWVVPASHDERRYAVFNVAEKRMDDRGYFAALHAELEAGGLSAMLHDLQHLDIGTWHPRQIVKTQALLEQKMQSMTPLYEWWESMLQDGVVPPAAKESPDIAAAVYLLHHARDYAPKLKDLTPARLGRFLAEHGCTKLHRASGNAWRFPGLAEARGQWARRYQGWKWERDARDWVVRA